MKASQFWQHCPQHGTPAISDGACSTGVAIDQALDYAVTVSPVMPACSQSVSLAAQNNSLRSFGRHCQFRHCVPARLGRSACSRQFGAASALAMQR
jgi:hypothetical protein